MAVTRVGLAPGNHLYPPAGGMGIASPHRAVFLVGVNSRCNVASLNDFGVAVQESIL